MNVGDTVTVRVHGDRDCDALVVATYEGEPDVLDVRIGDKRPIRVTRSDDPKPFTWRLA